MRIPCCCPWLLWFKRGADYVFHHIERSETCDEVPCSSPGPRMESPDDWGVTHRASLSPLDSEYHVPSSSLPAWDPVTIMTTVVTGQRGKCRLHKPLGGFSRKTWDFWNSQPHWPFFLSVRLHRKLLQIIPQALEEWWQFWEEPEASRSICQ